MNKLGEPIQIKSLTNFYLDPSICDLDIWLLVWNSVYIVNHDLVNRFVLINEKVFNNE